MVKTPIENPQQTVQALFLALIFNSSFLLMQTGEAVARADIRGSCHPPVRPGFRFWLLASGWLSPIDCGNLGMNQEWELSDFLFLLLKNKQAIKCITCLFSHTADLHARVLHVLFEAFILSYCITYFICLLGFIYYLWLPAVSTRGSGIADTLRAAAVGPQHSG